MYLQVYLVNFVRCFIGNVKIDAEPAIIDMNLGYIFYNECFEKTDIRSIPLFLLGLFKILKE